jgi:hypothetical protein
MAFQFSDSHIAEYWTHGYAIFRGILPPSLLTDLRRTTDRAREIARKKQGPQTQRLQPISAYDVDQRPFQDYAELPALKDAVARLLGPRATHGNIHSKSSALGVLLEPAELPYCTQWHRDWRDNVRGLRLAEWDKHFLDVNYFNQVNCALYEDSSTWVVPGSHLRRDLTAEARRFPARPIPGPDLEGKTSAERERLCLEYCQSMPGAVRLHLDAGDFTLYRNSLWHLGNYLPYRKRATLHEIIETPEYAAWRVDVHKDLEARHAAGLEWENPNQLPA